MRSIILGLFRFSGRDWNHDNRQHDRSKRKFFKRNSRTGILVEHTAIQRSSKIVIQQTNSKNFIVQSAAAETFIVQRNNVIGEPTVFEFRGQPRSVTRFC